MAWGDDPADLIGMTQTINGVNYVNQWVSWSPGSEPVSGWVPVPVIAPVVPAAPPPPVPPSLQFSANIVGQTTMLIYGQCRTPGQIIWAPRIDASNNVLDTSYLTFAACYGEPIDPVYENSSQMIINRMWANGTLIYDYALGGSGGGGVPEVDSIDSTAQADLFSCIGTMEIYWGDEVQTSSPIIAQYIDAPSVPAYRGLRYCVFENFPVIVTNNTVPNITIEWKRRDGLLVNVSDAMDALIKRVDWRSQYAQARSGIVFGNGSVTGIDDQCNGLVITSQQNLIDHFSGERNLFRFQIREGDPITIVRREVDSSLVIDIEVDEQDLVSTNGSPALITNRANPADFPVGINLSYSDPDHAYDLKNAPALFDGSQPGRSSATSSAIVSLQTQYVMDATTARSLAFRAMFQMRAYAAHVGLEMSSMEAEIGDTIAVTTSDGDTYVLLVDAQTITKNRSNQINALQLLTASGGDVNGDGGNDGGSTGKKKWPQDVLLADFVVTADHFYSAIEFSTIFSVNVNPGPQLRIGTSKWRDMIRVDSAGANWGNGDSLSFAGNMFEDDEFVYWMAYGYLIFSRLSKTASLISEIETWTIPAGFADGLETNFNQPGSYGFTFKDGKLYIPWQHGFNGSLFADNNDIKLVVVDMGAWGDQTSAAWEIHDVHLYTSGTAYGPIACCVLDNGVVVMPSVDNSGLGTTTRFYTSTIGALGSWSSVDNSSGFRPAYTETMAHSGNVIYATEWFGLGGLAGQSHRIALWDFTSGLSETLVDLRDDPNVVGIAQIRGWEWRSDTHYFVYCNHVNYNNSDFPVTAPRRYVARRKLSDGSADGGVFLDQIIWNGFDFEVFRGHFFNGKNYLHLDVFSRLNTRLVEISEDLDPATVTIWWPQQAATPANNAFASAALLTLGRVAQVDMRYCSTESAEDYPPWAVPTTGSANDPYTYRNGHSLWFKYTAAATATRTISVSSVLSTIKAISSGLEFGKTYGLVVWTGSALGGLTPIAHYNPGGGTGVNTLTFSAVSGTTYHISIYAYAGMTAGVFTADIFGGGFDLDPQFFGITTLELT